VTAFDDQQTLADARRRLRRVQGQVGGILAMLDEGRDCRDVIQQISAAARALDRVGCKLLVSQLRTCLLEDEAAVDESELERLFLSLR